jgi:transposase
MPSRYTEEFKQEVVRLRRDSGKSYRELAEDLGVSAYSIRKWVAEAAIAGGEAVSISEREELRKLRRENRILREEREILRKAAAFFAMESRPNRS